MPYVRKWKVHVNLAYLDESFSQDHIAIFGAVIIPHGEFGWVERLHQIAIEQLFSVDEIEDKFDEFHGWELFKGEGAFKGIDKAKRFDAIRVLLMAIRDHHLPFIYGAVDEKKLAADSLSKGLFGTARPLTAAFRLCVLGVEDWAQSQHDKLFGIVEVDYKDQYLLIVDDAKDQELKKQVRAAYRLLRAKRPYTGKVANRLWHSHDEMYFGNSRECIGIQMADLCTYFMQRHLLKRDRTQRDDGDEFFDMFAAQAICAKPRPEWSEYCHLLLCHDRNEREEMVQSGHDANAKDEAPQ